MAGGATGTGTVTLLAPITNTNRTLTLPDETTTVVGTDATQTLTNKSIAVTQLTGTLTVANGGTGAATLAANNVVLGNGTSAVQLVAPGTNGNVLTSNGTTWASTAPAGGGVTSLNSQTGAITNTSLYAIGGYVIGRGANATNYTVDTTLAGASLNQTSTQHAWEGGAFVVPGLGTATTGPSATGVGTWRCVSGAVSTSGGYGLPGLWVRIS
jgi:hypothetical protein